jgi:hypothetical protein
MLLRSAYTVRENFAASPTLYLVLADEIACMAGNKSCQQKGQLIDFMKADPATARSAAVRYHSTLLQPQVA